MWGKCERVCYGILLGAETLRGKYPVDTVRTVASICRCGGCGGKHGEVGLQVSHSSWLFLCLFRVCMLESLTLSASCKHCQCPFLLPRKASEAM